MKIPVIHGWIDRRILINFTADPVIVQQILPEGFRPKLQKGKAIVGVCLIRLKHIKPRGFPDFMGISSENGAHRIAVEWEEDGVTKEGVYIPRRDTSSKLNAFAGGRLFPGRHYHAQFNVQEGEGNYHVDYTSSDHTNISITARVADMLPATSVFNDIEEASGFFRNGDVGYSPHNSTRLDGIKLHVYNWKVQPLDVSHVYASYFEDASVFKGAVRFDNALLMTQIEHEWISVNSRKVEIRK